jgi:hypothetical protein
MEVSIQPHATAGYGFSVNCFIDYFVSPSFGVDVKRRIACLLGNRTKAIQPLPDQITGLAIRKQINNIIIKALQPFAGPWPLFQFLIPIHSW